MQIVWRLESRKSFAINKMVTRNNEIERRIKSGMDYDDVLPTSLKGQKVNRRSLANEKIIHPLHDNKAPNHPPPHGLIIQPQNLLSRFTMQRHVATL